MELRHFRYFLTLAKHLNFTRAANAVHITQSTLSHQIRQMEDELGYRLFNRLGRTVTLTEYGEALVPGATKALAELDEAVRGLKQVAAGPTGNVRMLLGTMAFSNRLLATCLETFAGRHRNICVSVEETSSSTLLRQMLEGGFDIGIGDEPPPNSGVRFEPLYQEEMMLLVSANHPMAGRRRIRITELHRQRLALPGKDVPVRRILDDCFRAAGVEPDVVVEMNQPGRLYKLAEQSDFAIIATRNLNALIPGSIKISLEDPTPFRTLGLLWNPGAEENLGTRLFAEVVREILRQRGPNTPAWEAVQPAIVPAETRLTSTGRRAPIESLS